MLKVPETTQEPDSSAPPPEKQTRRRTLRAMAFAGLAAVLVLAAVAGGFAWQVSRGSVSLDFLRERVEASIRSRLPPDSVVSIGSTALSYRRDQGVLLRARDVRLALSDIATVELADLATVTSLSALAGGRVDLRSVTVTGAEIKVALPPLERVGSAADMARAAVSLFMAQVLKTDDIIRGAGLQEAVVKNAALQVIDQAGNPGPALRISEANWAPLGIGRSKVWLQVVENNAAGWDLTIERQETRSGSAAVNVEIEDLPTTALAPDLADTDEDDAYFESAITLQARMVARRDGSFQGLRGVLSTGSGPLSISGVDRINVKGTAVSFSLGAVGNRLAFPKGEVRTGAGTMIFEGAVDLGEADKASLVARVRSGVLPTVGSDRPIRVTGGGLLAHFDLVHPALDVERFRLVADGGTLSAIGQASFSGESPGLSLALSLSKMPTAVARAFWPPFVADKTRRWFDANVQAGTLGPATLQVSLPADHIGRRGRDRVVPDNAIIGSLPFEDAAFSPSREFPVVRQMSGYVDFGDATATVLAQSGSIDIPGKGELQVGGTILVVPELGRPNPSGDLHLQLAGPASALAALSNNPPLAIAAGRGIDPDALSGQAQLLLDGRIPLTETDFQGVSTTFRLTLTDFSSASPIDNRLLADADLVLQGSSESFTVKGEGTMDGLQASVDLMMGSAALGQSDVTVSLDDAARERLGLRTGGVVTGPVRASIKRSDDIREHVLLDLKDARINLPALGWEKGKGVPATASFVMEKSEEGTRISELVLVGKGFGAKGELSLTPDGRIHDLKLPELALRAEDRLSVTATSKGGGYDVRVSGGAFDARGLLRSVGTDMSGGDAAIFPLRLTLDVGKVIGQNDVVLSEVTGSVSMTAKGLEKVSLKGAFNGQRQFEWELGRTDGTRTLHVATQDGGALIRFAGNYNKLQGGNLTLDYRGGSGGGSGVVVMRNFRLLNETALAPAVRTARQAADRNGVVPAAAQNSGDLQFTQMRIPFRQEGWVFNIEDAALRGPMLGATASGTVNIPGKRVAISGTFIPAFGLNNIAGSIPIIGTILGGGRDEGLVGITYKFFGPIDDPKLAMNPISAIAPGIFRKIFEYR